MVLASSRKRIDVCVWENNDSLRCVWNRRRNGKQAESSQILGDIKTVYNIIQEEDRCVCVWENSDSLGGVWNTRRNGKQAESSQILGDI
jgi:hypothetical protein